MTSLPVSGSFGGRRGDDGRARGLLYGFHRLCGTADLTLQEAVSMLRDAWHAALADDIEQTLVGRDIMSGCWSLSLSRPTTPATGKCSVTSKSTLAPSSASKPGMSSRRK
jgi:hypothetical protein